MAALVVYLDQWVWINLSRVHYGKSEEWRTGYDAVIQAARDRTAIFPLSLSHLTETARRTEDGSRGRLAEFMATVWDANAIRPWAQMMKPEVRNAVRKRLGVPVKDLREFALGKGIAHVLGAELELVPKVPNPDITQGEKAVEMAMSPDRWRDLKDASIAESLRTTSPVDAAFATKLQSAIDREVAGYQPGKKRDSATARFLMEVVVDPLIAVLAEARVDSRTFWDAHLQSREQLESFLQDLPTLNTFHTLNYERNTSRRVKPNDIWDFALCIAIPYCDVVATEPAWCNLAEKNGLDDLYRTKLVHKPEALAAAIAGGAP